MKLHVLTTAALVLLRNFIEIDSFRPTLFVKHHNRCIITSFLPSNIHAATKIAPAASRKADLKMIGGLGNVALQFSSLLVLTFVVAVHEAGHFSAAVLQKIRVQNFSIGFGPKLISYKQSEGLQLFGRETAQTDARSNPEKSGKDGVEYAVRLIPIGGYVSFPVNTDQKEDGTLIEDNDPDLLQNRPANQRAVVISAGIIANLILTWFCMFAIVTNQGLPKTNFSPGVVLTSFTDLNGPAYTAGFKPKDRLLEIDGFALRAGEDALSSAVSKIKASNGRPINVSIERDGNIIEKVVQPTKQSGPNYSIGVKLTANSFRSERVPEKNPLKAAQRATEESAHLVQITWNGLTKAVLTRDYQNLEGPIAVVQQGAELARDDGLPSLVQFAAIISVNLAVINSLPIPGLDGGQMMLLLFESINGKKMKPGVADTINGVAILVLVSVGVSSIVRDLIPIFSSIVK